MGFLLFPLCLTFLFLITAGPVCAADLSTMLRSDASTAGIVSREMLRAPFHGSPTDYWTAGGLATGIVLASFFDRTVRGEVPDWHDGWLTSVDGVGRIYSRAYCNFGIAGGLYMAGLAGSNETLRRTGVEIVEAFGFAHAGTQSVKRLLSRHRPYNNDGPFVFAGPQLKDRYLSFPSGDVTNVVTLSAVLSSEIHHPAATVVLYGLAATTVFQRMHKDKHWFSDTLGAAVWSVAVSRAVVRLNHRQQSTRASRFELAPSLAGASLVVHF